MFLTLWHYLRGYVIVEISGFGLNKFIRLVVDNHITLWSVKRDENKIYAHMSISGFKALKSYAKKARCRVKIVEKKGLPFLSFRYRRRVTLAAGSILFVLALYVLSAFVWVVEVKGNQRLDATDIIETLEASGYEVGKLKNGLELREAEQILMNTYPDIVWVGIDFEGTKMCVELSESVLKPAIHEEQSPCHLTAKRDTLITYIVAETGMPMVKIGDTVKQGDILISGAIPLQDELGGTFFTEAKGMIKGKTGYSLTTAIPLTGIEKDYTEKTATSYVVKLFDHTIPLFTSQKTFEHFDTLITTTQLALTSKLPLPFYIEKYQKVQYDPIETVLDEEKAKDILIGRLFDALDEKIEQGATILKQELNFKIEENQLVGELNVIAEENIGTVKALTEEELLIKAPTY